MTSTGVNVSDYAKTSVTSNQKRNKPSIPPVMLTSAFQVLRYSALFAGVSYGLYRQSNLNAQSHKAKVDRDYAHQASLISQAKAEFKKKNTPPETATKGGNDPSDPKFDLEGYLTALMGEKAT
ncbi:MAG: hypothetical protein Q9172_006038 [Xanthocarpia lactea]